MSDPSNIIICADGTWNQVQEKDPASGLPVSTNVARLASMIVPEVKQGEKTLLQKVFYMQGVGSSKEESLEGGAFGFGLTENIMRAYSFIVKNYTPGDRLYFFGFSRGAYTVRSLGGLLRTAGILRSDAAVKVDDAMELYCNPQFEADPDLPACQIFRRMHSHLDNSIECIGVWDTVGSLGIPSMSPALQRKLDISWHFHDVSLGHHVKNAFHALAVHERRSTFQPAIWKKSNTNKKQNLVQRWFPGAHSDVGGGYIPDVEGTGGSEKRYLLANLALRWMIEMTNGTHAATAGFQGLSQVTSIVYEADWKQQLKIGDEDHKQMPHNSRGTVWQILDFLMGRRDGYVRPCGSLNGETCESIDESVVKCLEFFKDKEKWKKTGLATHSTFTESIIQRHPEIHEQPRQ